MGIFTFRLAGEEVNHEIVTVTEVNKFNCKKHRRGDVYFSFLKFRICNDVK